MKTTSCYSLEKPIFTKESINTLLRSIYRPYLKNVARERSSGTVRSSLWDEWKHGGRHRRV